MNEQLQKIHDLLESIHTDERMLGKQLLSAYIETAEKPDVSTLLVGTAYDVTGIVWENGIKPHIKTVTRIFKGLTAHGLIMFSNETLFVDRLLSILPSSTAVWTND